MMRESRRRSPQAESSRRRRRERERERDRDLDPIRRSSRDQPTTTNAPTSDTPDYHRNYGTSDSHSRGITTEDRDRSASFAAGSTSASKPWMGENPDYYTAEPDPIPPHSSQPPQPRSRARGHARAPSSSGSDSSSPSYLDISRRYDTSRFGGVLNAFFRAPSEHRRQQRRVKNKAKKRAVFPFGNSSSSSVNSDLAYGDGFIPQARSSRRRSRSDGRPRNDYGEQFQPGKLQRRQTDEEIVAIGRQLSDLAKRQNDEDLRAAGRSRPSKIMSAAAGLTTLSQLRKGKKDGVRGIGSSKPAGRSSDDEDWESASDDDSSDDNASALAYGASKTNLPGVLGGAAAAAAGAGAIWASQSGRRASGQQRQYPGVDPSLFGPVNSLNGMVTPVPFRDDDRYNGSSYDRRRDAPTVADSIASLPMRQVYPVPTSQPDQYDARHSGSLAGSRSDDIPKLPRPGPAPIQAPVPISPVSAKVYDAQSLEEAGRREDRERRRISEDASRGISSAAKMSFGTAATAAVAAAALKSYHQRGRDEDYRSYAKVAPKKLHRSERSDHERRRSERDAEPSRYAEREARYERERDREKDRDRDRDRGKEKDQDRTKEHRRSKDSISKSKDDRDYKRSSRHDDYDDRTSRRIESDKDKDKRSYKRDRENIKVEYDDDKTSHRSRRDDKMPADRDYAKDIAVGAIIAGGAALGAGALASGSATEGPERPLTPAVFTIDREPTFDDWPPRSPSPDVRLSRKDSFEIEKMADDSNRQDQRVGHEYEDTAREAKSIYDEAKQATVPVSTAAVVAAVAAETHRGRERRRDEYSDDGSRERSGPSKDSVQEEADRYYREAQAARKVAEDEARSRSRSKGRVQSSKEDEEPEITIVTPPGYEEDKNSGKSPYDAPNADVRIDNQIYPSDTHKFRSSGGDLEAPVFKSRDPSAERERPLLNLVMPTPIPSREPTPAPSSTTRSEASEEPERDEKSSKRDKKDKKKEKKKSKKSKDRDQPDAPEPGVEIVMGPKGDVVQTPSTPKSVTWGENETKSFEVESPEQERKDTSDKERPRLNKASKWGILAAAIAGSSTEPANEPESTTATSASRAISSEIGDRSLDDIGDPPIPGPKPASADSTHMPGSFADDVEFAGTLAAGLQDAGFDPNIVVNDPVYRRRDSPPGSDELHESGFYKKGFSSTVEDLSTVGEPMTPGSGFVIGETETPKEEIPDEWAEVPAKVSKKEKRKQEKLAAAKCQSMDLEETTPSQPAESQTFEEPTDFPLSKKEQKKRAKAAKARALAGDDDWDTGGQGTETPTSQTQGTSTPPSWEAGEEEWDAPSSKKKKGKNRKSKDFSELENDKVSVPVDAFNDIQASASREANPEDDWDAPKRKKKSKSSPVDSPSRSAPASEVGSETGSKKKSKRRSMAEDDFNEWDGDPPDRKRVDPFEERDVSSVVSESRYDDRKREGKSKRSSRYGDDDDDTKSVASAPGGSRKSKDEKRSSGIFSSIFSKSNGHKDDDKKESFLDNAGTLGAGVGLAGAAAVIAAAASSRQHATEASSEIEQNTKDGSEVPREPEESFDPEIAPRVIKPAIDPQYGDLLPLPPSEPGSPKETPVELPELPDSRPDTPPEERNLREQERIAHVRRRSTQETPTKSPSRTAIPIQLRLGPRSNPGTPGFLKSSPLNSPGTPDSAGPSKRSARPTSWDSSRGPIPLQLPRHVRHGSTGAAVQETDLQMIDALKDVGAIPASAEPSAAIDEVKHMKHQPLHLDMGELPPAKELAGSQETTPKAEIRPEFPAVGAEPSSVIHDGMLREHPLEEGALGGVSGDVEPEPIDPMSKNRSSYLLNSTPTSIRSDRSFDPESQPQSPPQEETPSKQRMLGANLSDIPEDLTSADEHFSDAREGQSEDDFFEEARSALSSELSGGSPTNVTPTRATFSEALPAEADRTALDPEQDWSGAGSGKKVKKGKKKTATASVAWDGPEDESMMSTPMAGPSAGDENLSPEAAIPNVDVSVPEFAESTVLERPASVSQDLDAIEDLAKPASSTPGADASTGEPEFALAPSKKDKRKKKKGHKQKQAEEILQVSSDSQQGEDGIRDFPKDATADVPGTESDRAQNELATERVSYFPSAAGLNVTKKQREPTTQAAESHLYYPSAARVLPVAVPAAVVAGMAFKDHWDSKSEGPPQSSQDGTMDQVVDFQRGPDDTAKPSLDDAKDTIVSEPLFSQDNESIHDLSSADVTRDTTQAAEDAVTIGQDTSTQVEEPTEDEWSALVSTKKGKKNKNKKQKSSIAASATPEDISKPNEKSLADSEPSMPPEEPQAMAVEPTSTLAEQFTTAQENITEPGEDEWATSSKKKGKKNRKKQAAMSSWDEPGQEISSGSVDESPAATVDPEIGEDTSRAIDDASQVSQEPIVSTEEGTAPTSTDETVDEWALPKSGKAKKKDKKKKNRQAMDVVTEEVSQPAQVPTAGDIMAKSSFQPPTGEDLVNETTQPADLVPSEALVSEDPVFVQEEEGPTSLEFSEQSTEAAIPVDEEWASISKKDKKKKKKKLKTIAAATEEKDLTVSTEDPSDLVQDVTLDIQPSIADLNTDFEVSKKVEKGETFKNAPSNLWEEDPAPSHQSPLREQSSDALHGPKDGTGETLTDTEAAIRPAALKTGAETGKDAVVLESWSPGVSEDMTSAEPNPAVKIPEASPNAPDALETGESADIDSVQASSDGLQLLTSKLLKDGKAESTPAGNEVDTPASGALFAINDLASPLKPLDLEPSHDFLQRSADQVIESADAPTDVASSVNVLDDKPGELKENVEQLTQDGEGSDFLFPMKKKAKKGKKSKPDTVLDSVADVEASRDPTSLDVEVSSYQEEPEHSQADASDPTTNDDIDSSFPPKPSKKDKKKKKGIAFEAEPATPDGTMTKPDDLKAIGTEVSSITDTAAADGAEPDQVEGQVTPGLNDASVDAEAQAEDEWKSPATSKKDKKKKKKAALVPTDDVPRQDNPTSIVADAVATEVASPTPAPDDWATATLSKKDKKKKKKQAALEWDQDSIARDEGLAPASMTEAVPGPDQIETSTIPDTAQLDSEAKIVEPIAAAEDEWALPVSSKKDKKKKKKQAQLDWSEGETPQDVNNADGDAETLAQETPAAPPDLAAKDDWATPASSKKDKKKMKKQAEPDWTEESTTPTDAKPVTEDATPPTEAVPGDNWDTPVLSKKDKKKKKKAAALAWDDEETITAPATTAADPAAEDTSLDGDKSTPIVDKDTTSGISGSGAFETFKDTTGLPSASVDDPQQNDGYTLSKKEKRSKKKAKAAALAWPEEEEEEAGVATEQTAENSQAQNMLHADQREIGTYQEPPSWQATGDEWAKDRSWDDPEVPREEDEDSWDVTAPKSKKKKKKSDRDQIATGEDPVSEYREPDPVTAAAPLPPPVDAPASVDDDDEWAALVTGTKTSHRDKSDDVTWTESRGFDGPSTDWADYGLSQDTTEEHIMPESIATVSDLRQILSGAEAEPQHEDKQDDIDESNHREPAEPTLGVNQELESGRIDADVSAEEKKPEGDHDSSQDARDQPNTMAEAADPIVKEAVPVDEWATTTKLSKKEKKKKKKQQALTCEDTPDSLPASQDDQVTGSPPEKEEETEEVAAKLQEPQISLTEPDPELDDWAPKKLSKKDKKKAEKAARLAALESDSHASTSLDPGQTVEPEMEAGPSQEEDLVPAPVPEVDPEVESLTPKNTKEAARLGTIEAENPISEISEPITASEQVVEGITEKEVTHVADLDAEEGQLKKQSKKDKKKADKAARLAALELHESVVEHSESAMATEQISEPIAHDGSAVEEEKLAPEATPAPEPDLDENEWAPKLSKKERKKAEKAARLAALSAEDASIQLADVQSGETESVRVTQPESVEVCPGNEPAIVDLTAPTMTADQPADSVFKEESGTETTHQTELLEDVAAPKEVMTREDADIQKEPELDEWAPSLSKKEKKKAEKAARLAATLGVNETPSEGAELPSPAPGTFADIASEEKAPEPSQADDWAPKMSKKDKKKAEKAARLAAQIPDNSEGDLEEHQPKPVAPVMDQTDTLTEELDGWAPRMSKKDKKKDEKAARLAAFDQDEPSSSGALPLEEETAPSAMTHEPSPVQETQPETDDWMPKKLSKKEKKKAEKLAKAAQSMTGDLPAEDVPAAAAPSSPTRQDDDVNEDTPTEPMNAVDPQPDLDDSEKLGRTAVLSAGFATVAGLLSTSDDKDSGHETRAQIAGVSDKSQDVSEHEAEHRSADTTQAVADATPNPSEPEPTALDESSGVIEEVMTSDSQSKMVVSEEHTPMATKVRDWPEEDEWALPVKKKGKRGKPDTAITSAPTEELAPAQPDEPCDVAGIDLGANDTSSVAPAPEPAGEDEWAVPIKSSKKSKRGKKKGSQAATPGETSRAVSPTQDAPTSEPLQIVSIAEEHTEPTPAISDEAWDVPLKPGKKSKKGKKKGLEDVTPPEVSRAESPSLGGRETHNAPAQPQHISIEPPSSTPAQEDDWAGEFSTSTSKKKKKKDRKLAPVLADLESAPEDRTVTDPSSQMDDATSSSRPDDYSTSQEDIDRTAMATAIPTSPKLGSDEPIAGLVEPPQPLESEPLADTTTTAEVATIEVVPLDREAKYVPQDETSAEAGSPDEGKSIEPVTQEDKSSSAGIGSLAAAATGTAALGGVAAIAEKFGGSKKKKASKKKKILDKRQPREDDLFDDPALWESADKKGLDDMEVPQETEDFWNAEDTGAAQPEIVDGAGNTGDGQLDPDQPQRHEEQLSQKQEKSKAMLPTPSSISPASESGWKETSRQGARLDDEFVESPVLGRGEQDSRQSKAAGPQSLASDASELETGLVYEDSQSHNLPSEKHPDDTEFRRSPSRGLPVVQELPEAETETNRELEPSVEVNRDSGFVADSTNPMDRSSKTFDEPHEEPQRDSGIHTDEWDEAPPHTPGNHWEHKLRRSPQSTPRLREPAEQSATPEPEKRRIRNYGSLADESTSSRGISGAGAAAAAALATGAAAASISAGRDSDPRSFSEGHARMLGDQGASPSPSLTSQRGEPSLRRTASNTSIVRQRTPEPLKFRPESPGIRSTPTPPLRRVNRRISTELPPPAPASRETNTPKPVANETKVRVRDKDKDMTDVYDGFGEGRIGSPRSPTRPHSMRRRQSMQVLELESKVEQLLAENRLLTDARNHAEQNLSQRATSVLSERDAEIENLKQSLQFLQNEVSRLTEVNEGLTSANAELASKDNSRYAGLEASGGDGSRGLDLAAGGAAGAAAGAVATAAGYQQTIQEKDDEIADLRAQLEDAKERVREMQRQILASKAGEAEFLEILDEDHFDHRCQQLCSHVQQWVLRFSKFSDMRACRLTSEINDEKTIDRLDNAVLDGSDVDVYLKDRVRRRDIFMSMTMNMIWEFVFTRYLFGMDREQRQKLKSLEKLLTEVGPPQAVRQWRAVTLTLLSRRRSFKEQRDLDTEAVVQAIFQTLCKILPPPSNLEDQIQAQLRRVMAEAVALSIQMRTQKAEYMMLPPLQPEYDADGELAASVYFNASMMNERSGNSTVSNEELEAQQAKVRIVLFPLVVKKGDDAGIGDEEIVVCPAQVVVASRHSRRSFAPSSDAGGASLGGAPSRVSVVTEHMT